MILNAMFSWAGMVLSGVLGLLPSPPSGISLPTGAFATFGQYLGWLNGFVPLTEAAAYAAIMLSLWVSFQVVRATIWLYHQVPFNGGGE